MLREMDGLRAVLQERRVERGALDLDLQEQKLVLDDEGEVLEVTSRSRDRAHNLIEEFMLMANEAVAQAATVREIPIIRRDHPAPSDDDVETFLRFVRAVAPDVRVSGADDFQRVVSQVAERPVAPVINMALLRTLMRAQYTAEKGRHFALATDEYCHFTSPIRRYPDLQVHRAIFDAPKGKRGASKSDRTVLGAVAEHCTLREQRAEEAEREMNKLRAIAWLAHRVGERFTGVITTALDYGFFVRLDECMVEGMVHVSTLGGDFYQLHEPSFSLRGRRSAKSFGIGDTIEVRLRRADPIHRHVDLEYLHHRAEPVVASGGGTGSTRKRNRTR